MKYLTIAFFIVGCTPVVPRVINTDWVTLLEITTDAELFSKKMAFKEIEWKSTLAETMETNFQSEYTLDGFGVIKGDEFIYSQDSDSATPFEIIDDYLIFTITFGGGVGTELVSYELIWDGIYHETGDQLSIDLLFSFKDIDHKRALLREELGYNLKPLQVKNQNSLLINFIGYEEFIEYHY